MSDSAHRTDESAGLVAGRGRLKGKRVLVIGGGTAESRDAGPQIGNGRAIALLAAREGARVAVADLSAEAAQGTVDLILADGGSGIALSCDVRDEDSVVDAVNRTVAEFGGLDGVVLNVGITVGGGILETAPDQWDAAFAVNSRGHFLVTRAVVPHLRPGASLVYISSTAGSIPSYVVSYDASKAAVEGLARHVASAFAGAGIRANVVAPHAVDTPLGRRYAAEAGLDSLDDLGLPFGRSGTPWEVAYAALFLLSDESSYTSGATIGVDGAFLLNGPHHR